MTGDPDIPEPVSPSTGARVAATLAAIAAEAGSGDSAAEAHAALMSAAARLLGAGAARLERKPDSADLAAALAEDVDAQSEPARSELRALADALRDALAAEGRAGAIDHRILAIASGQHAIAAGRDVNIGTMQVTLTQAPQIDVALVLLVAESQGYLSPEKAQALEDQVRRTQSDLERLRRDNPDWAGAVDAAITAFNASDLAAARAAFARIDDLIAERRAALLAEEATLRLEAARSKHAQATLFHPFEASKAEPLLAAAAELAETDIWFWIDCGLSRIEIGSLKGAQEAFSKAHALARGSNAHREVSVSLHYLGDVRLAQGSLVEALAAFEEGLAVLRARACKEPESEEAARDVSISLHKIGDVRVAQGDLPGARVAYEEALTIARDLAARDTGNAGWARDVSVSLNRVGNVRVAEGDLPGARAAYEEDLMIARGLADRDPGNAGWARDVSVGLEKVGNVRVAQGDLPGAREAYEEGLTIRRGLAARDPGNADWARDISVSLGRVGNVRIAEGDLPGARDAYEEGLTIARGLAARDPGNARWARDVLVLCWRLATNDPENAVVYWSEVVSSMEEMDRRGVLLLADRPFLEIARARLAAQQNP